MPDQVLAMKIPHLTQALVLLVELIGRGELRLHNSREIKKWSVVLNTFEGVVTSEHRLAYDNSFRLIGEIHSHMLRQLGSENPSIESLRQLTKAAR